MNIFGKFPLVRLKQFRDNPGFIWHYLKRLLYYKYVSHRYMPLYKDYTFLGAPETLEYLMSNRVSLARFSDGDMEQLTGAGEYPPDSDWSQRNSKKLRERLEKVLRTNDTRLLIAHESPNVFLKTRKEAAVAGVVYNMWTDTRMILHNYLSKDAVYGHAHVFVPHHNPNLDWERFHAFLSTKNVVIVTGGTEKLKNVHLGRQTFFIETGKHDAFERYEEIVAAIRQLFANEALNKDDSIIMASLGPTADILADDLSKEGFQVWDTGHFFKFTHEKFLSMQK